MLLLYLEHLDCHLQFLVAVEVEEHHLEFKLKDTTLTVHQHVISMEQMVDLRMAVLEGVEDHVIKELKTEALETVELALQEVAVAVAVEDLTLMLQIAHPQALAVAVAVQQEELIYMKSNFYKRIGVVNE